MFYSTNAQSLWVAGHPFLASPDLPNHRTMKCLDFALLCALFSIPLTQAKIEVRGDEDFKNKAIRALDDIERTTPNGRLLVRSLQTSRNTHIIRQTRANVDSNAPHSLTDASSRLGTGSTTRWNPNLTKPYADGVNRDPTAALFHELCHAYEADRGVWDGSLDPGTGIRKSEIKAIKTENLYRRAKGLPERKNMVARTYRRTEMRMRLRARHVSESMIV
jgi:hypothetical protein